MFPSLSSLRSAAAAALVVLAAGCAVGPDYQRPDSAASASFKEAEGWSAAAPSDAVHRGDWWSLFQDPQLDELAKQVAVSNQNIAAAQAAYAQARALVREQRAGLFPTIDLNGSGTRSDSGGGSSRIVTDSSTGETTLISSGSSISNSYQASIGASWEPDVWGRLRRTVENASASAQASAADLASATLSAQGELVTDYLSLRETDAEIGLLKATLEGYERALQIAQNRYRAGIAARTDVLSAQTQLYGTQADMEGLARTRGQLEHAIAVLVGQAPANFRLEPSPWNGVVPSVPVGVPSELLQRRPDIAGAERRVASANAQIGIARSAYFPSLSLSASYGSSTSSLGDLFSASSMLWSIGASATETLLDFGARKAQVAQARAAYDQAVATYRQTVLTAFADVEDQLTGVRVLERTQELRAKASAVADENEGLILNQYKAGQVSYTEVVTAQASALSARRTLIQSSLDRQTTAVALIQALGGGWEAPP
ncbi:MAG: outer rane efflux protein NodT family [Hydrocarboniphaga sp.]|uniref:efflux transporter outer membrane subunit n=1 Tax=Hydrocarboniphaga sp. TaxID=2033016 RepID=UPI0026336A16|nr:efflux transporter outer membrane subunit [Hydrocarboniphaga sp.]MDB5970503.1 outer rane efflux protein NodT family [Hydrocarboniphaga sp.]